VRSPLGKSGAPLLILIGTIAALAIFTSTMSKNPALPLLAQSIGADAAQVGLISAISPIPGILISSFAGAYSDKHGRNRMVLISLLIFASAPFTYLFVTEIWQLAIIRFYHGFATAIFMPVAMAAIADHYPAEVRGQALGTYSSFTMVGRFSAPFAGGALIYFANFGFLYLTCGITAIIALVLALLVRWDRPLVKKSVIESSGSMLTALRDVVKDRRIVLTSSMEGIQYFAMGAFEAFLPLYCLSLGLNGLEIGAIMGVQVISMLLAKPLMGRFSDQRGRRPSIVAGLLAGSAVILLMPFSIDPILLAVFSVLFGITVAMVTASTSALVCELAGCSAHGSAIGVLSSIMDIGHSLGPLITGAIVTLVSFQLGFGVAATLLLVGAFAFYFGMRRIDEGLSA
jgi:DHA1 family multidrug resistance protein-like MFS transporter